MLSKLRPTRQQAENTSNDNAELVCDLDQIIAKSVKVTLKGKTHYLKPIQLGEFLKATRTMQKMDEMHSKGTATVKEIYDVYFEFISSVCDTITHKDLSEMHLVQVGALIQTVLDHVTGKAGLEEKKKELMRSMIQKG